MIEILFWSGVAAIGAVVLFGWLVVVGNRLIALEDRSREEEEDLREHLNLLRQAQAILTDQDKRKGQRGEVICMNRAALLKRQTRHDLVH